LLIGDIADSIEANVETAATSVEEGSEQLRQARRHQVTVLCLCCLKTGIAVISFTVYFCTGCLVTF